MTFPALTLALAIGALNAPTQDPAAHGEPPVHAPFEKLDSLCVNDWWERAPS